jgi:hypothetical protein
MSCKGNRYQQKEKGGYQPQNVYQMFLLSGILPKECDEGKANAACLDLPQAKISIIIGMSSRNIRILLRFHSSPIKIFALWTVKISIIIGMSSRNIRILLRFHSSPIKNPNNYRNNNAAHSRSLRMRRFPLYCLS